MYIIYVHFLYIRYIISKFTFKFFFFKCTPPLRNCNQVVLNIKYITYSMYSSGSQNSIQHGGIVCTLMLVV